MTLFWVGIFIVSLAVLIKSSDFFTDKAEKIGLFLGLSPLVVGATIVALGTSLPELATGYMAMTNGLSEVVYGTVVGSNIANIFLVLGVSAIVARPILSSKESLIDNQLVMLFSVMLGSIVFALDGQVVWQEGLFLLALYGVMMWSSLSKKDESTVKKDPVLAQDIIILLLAGVGIYFGAEWTINSLIKIGEIFSLSETFIALTAVAIGTSLPEMVVSAVAAYKGKGSMALGNIVGSCVFNVGGIIGVLSLVAPLVVSQDIITIAFPAMVIATFMYFILAMKKSLTRYEGLTFLVMYGVYIYFLI